MRETPRAVPAEPLVAPSQPLWGLDSAHGSPRFRAQVLMMGRWWVPSGSPNSRPSPVRDVGYPQQLAPLGLLQTQYMDRSGHPELIWESWEAEEGQGACSQSWPHPNQEAEMVLGQLWVTQGATAEKGWFRNSPAAAPTPVRNGDFRPAEPLSHPDPAGASLLPVPAS